MTRYPVRFLFGEPGFVKTLDPEKTASKAFRIENEQLALTNRLRQKRVARDCAEWIREKVEIRSVKKAGFLHGKLYHVNNQGIQEAIVATLARIPLPTRLTAEHAVH